MNSENSSSLSSSNSNSTANSSISEMTTNDSYEAEKSEQFGMYVSSTQDSLTNETAVGILEQDEQEDSDSLLSEILRTAELLRPEAVSGISSDQSSTSSSTDEQALSNVETANTDNVALRTANLLRTLETGITETDMTAELPSAVSAPSAADLNDTLLETAVPVPDDIQSVQNKAGSDHNAAVLDEDKAGLVQDSAGLIPDYNGAAPLHSETATSGGGSTETSSSIEYSSTDLTSSTDFTDSAQDSADSGSTTEYTLVKKYTGNNDYNNTDLEISINKKAVPPDTAALDDRHMATAEEASHESSTFTTIDYDPIITESDTHQSTN